MHTSIQQIDFDKGEATVIFFTNARNNEKLDISVRGITKEGELINWN